jgi:hypothetical protein
VDPFALLMTMCKALDERQAEVEEAEAWYEGEHPIEPPPPNTFAGADREARLAFDKLSRLAITNMLPPVVDVVASKLRVEGFRFSASPTSTDTEAWDLFTRNHLDADQHLVHVGALSTGQTTAIVWADSGGRATVSIEDPEQTIVMYEAGSRRKRVAGLKRWCGDDEHVWATLYTPKFVYKFRSIQKHGDMNTGEADPRSVWEAREVLGEAWPLPNPLGEVSMVEARVNPELKPSRFGGGEPEFEKQINPQRRMNATTLAMLLTMERQSFRQRWIIGWEPPTNSDGTPDKYALLKASAANIWNFGDETVKVGEFAQADFRPFIDVNLTHVKEIASTSSTPPYAFLIGDMVNVAADALARIEGNHTAKVLRHATTLGSDFYREVMRLAFKVENNPKALDPATVVWADITERTATEQANLAKTAKDLGAPDQAVFAMFPDVDQQEAARWVVEGTANRLIQQAAIPAVARP